MQVNELKQIKKDIESLMSRTEGESSLAVKIYYTDEDNTYNVEIWYNIDGEFKKSFYTDEYESEKEALKRAKAVLTQVKKWWKLIEVSKEIEWYAA